MLFCHKIHLVVMPVGSRLTGPPSRLPGDFTAPVNFGWRCRIKLVSTLPLDFGLVVLPVMRG